MPCASPASVDQIAVPPAARSLTTLRRIDYEDAFLTGAAPAARTAEQCARAALEEAPLATRHALRSGWAALGLRLGSTRSRDRVLGWEMRRSSPAFVVLGARSLLGFDAEVLFRRQRRALLVATFLELGTPLARAVWPVVAAGHRQAVRYTLAQCA